MFQLFDRFPDGVIAADPDKAVRHDSAGAVRRETHQVLDRLRFFRFHRFQAGIDFINGKLTEQIGQVVIFHQIQNFLCFFERRVSAKSPPDSRCQALAATG